MLPERNSSCSPSLPWRAQGPGCALSLRVCPTALEAGGCKVQPAQPLITHQPLPNLGTSLRISNCAGGKRRAGPIKVFPRINRRKKEKNLCQLGLAPGRGHCLTLWPRVWPFEGGFQSTRGSCHLLGPRGGFCRRHGGSLERAAGPEHGLSSLSQKQKKKEKPGWKGGGEGRRAVNKPGEEGRERFPGEGAGSAAAAAPPARKQLVRGEHRGLGISQPPNLPGLAAPSSHPRHRSLGVSPSLGFAARRGFLGWRDGVYIAKLPLLPACLQGGLGLASPEACTAPPARGLPLVNIWVCLQPKVDKVTGELAGSRRNSKNLELSELSASRLKKHSTNVGRRGGLDTALRCLCFDSSPLWELFWAPAPALLPFTPAELLDLGDHS